MVIDFKGPTIESLGNDSGVQPVVEARNGRIVGDVSARPVVGTDRWRLSFDLARDPEARDPIEVRAWLKLNGNAITETWLGQATTGRKGTSKQG